MTVITKMEKVNLNYIVSLPDPETEQIGKCEFIAIMTEGIEAFQEAILAVKTDDAESFKEVAFETAERVSKALKASSSMAHGKLR